MRYGHPSLAAALAELRAAGAQRLLVLPLYPQYSATTVASTFDAVAAELRTWRWLPELRVITHYPVSYTHLDVYKRQVMVWLHRQRVCASKLV